MPNAHLVHVKSTGPGCPVQSRDQSTSVVGTMYHSLAWNQDQTDYTWYSALNLPPTIGAGLWPDETDRQSRWCTHEWKFLNSTGYRLVANKNGTEISAARYNLPKGLSAVWKVTNYHPDGSEHEEKLTVNGPLGGIYFGSTPEKPEKRVLSETPSKSWKTGCAEEEHVLKIKTESSVQGDGATFAEVWGGERDFFNRIQQIVSYGWEKCD